MISCFVKRRSLLGILFSGLLLSGLLIKPVYAESISWEQLSSKEQKILKPFQNKWAGYSTTTRKIMRRWAGLSSGERLQIKKRHQQWGALSSASKTKIIRKLDRYKRMPLTKRLKLQAWRKWVRSLPKHEQQQLHKKLPGMGLKERREYIRRLEKKYGKR